VEEAGAGGIGQNSVSYNQGADGHGMAINMNGTVQNYAQGGRGGMWDVYPDTVSHIGHGGNGGRPHNIGFVGSSGVVFLRHSNLCLQCRPDSNSRFVPCVTCPAGYIFSSTDNGTCVLCTANTYNPIKAA